LTSKESFKPLAIATLLSFTLILIVNFWMIYPRFSETIISKVEDEAARVARHLRGEFFPNLRELDMRLLDRDRILATETELGLYKVKLFNEAGVLLYASDGQDIGTVNGREYFRRQLARGQQYTQLVRKDGATSHGFVLDRDVVETYVPIMSGSRFLGAFEIYYDVTALKQDMDANIRYSSLVLLVLVLGSLGLIAASMRAAFSSMAKLERTRAQMEEAREASERASEAKSEFLAKISHELRTPLNGIVGFAELIRYSGASRNLRDYAGLILTESESLQTLINELLDDAKITANKIELEQLPFDLGRSLERLSSPMRVLARKKNLDYSCDIDPEVPLRLVGDPTRLHQILANLVGNAFKFTQIGRVWVHVEMLEESGTRVRLKFSVSDTGIGIAQDKLPRIFERYVQADGSTTRRYGGTGLGTSIARQLVELMGGEIGVQSTPGEGSTFWFSIAFEKRYQPSRRLPAEPPPMDEALRGRGRILLAEDCRTNQEVARTHLESAGYEVDIAENGQAALELARRNRYDLILMDINMPLMDGIEATLRIRRASGRCRGGPVVAMTANAYGEDRTRCLAAGMVDVITKPIRRSHFLETVSRLAGRAQEPPSLPAPENGACGLPLDYPGALSEFEGNAQVLGEILDGFVANLPTHEAALEQALARGDLESIRRHAHALKGAAGNLAAYPLADAAGLLEDFIKMGQHDGIAPALGQLKMQCTELRSFVAQLQN